jgi:proline iminopeptidase
MLVYIAIAAALALVLLTGCSSREASTVPSVGTDAKSAGWVEETPVLAGGSVMLQTRSVGPVDARETLIAIHGGPGLSLEAMSTFDNLAGPNRRVVSYDQRGAGRSTRPDDFDYSLKAQVADLEAIRNALGTESVQLVGQSWGGAVAAAYAATYPDRVSALILVASVPLDRAEYLAGQRRFQARVAELQRIKLIDDEIPPIDNGSCLAAYTAILPAYLDDPTFEIPTTATSCNGETSRATYEAFVTDETVSDYAARLTSFDSPVLLLAGENDAYGPDWITRQKEILTNAPIDTVLIASAGHLVGAEQSDATMSAITTFLTD